jgi:hypothetical protein
MTTRIFDALLVPESKPLDKVSKGRDGGQESVGKAEGIFQKRNIKMRRVLLKH